MNNSNCSDDEVQFVGVVTPKREAKRAKHKNACVATHTPRRHNNIKSHRTFNAGSRPSKSKNIAHGEVVQIPRDKCTKGAIPIIDMTQDIKPKNSCTTSIAVSPAKQTTLCHITRAAPTIDLTDDVVEEGPSTTMTNSPFISFQGDLLVEILTYLPPLDMLNFSLSSVGVMLCVSDAAESVLNNMVESVKSDGDGNLSYLNGITQDSDETCMLSGNRKWGVFSRINQINHYSSIRFAPALGGAKLSEEGFVLHVAPNPHGNRGFAHTRFIMAHGTHRVKFRFNSEDCDGFNRWTSFGIARPLSYKNIDRWSLDVAEPDVLRLYPEEWQSETLINIVNLVTVTHDHMRDFGFHLEEHQGAKTGRMGFSRMNRWSFDRHAGCKFSPDKDYGLELDMSSGAGGKLSLFIEEGFFMKKVCDLAVGLTGGFVWTARVGRDDWDCAPAVKLVEWDLMECPIIEPDESDTMSPYMREYMRWWGGL